ncbi:MAG: AAA family ATPase, partial [Cyanothece sp. SIO1E1]|nr:AAA family ATPase [Cyanothece sp. SIO1E1]
MISTFVALPGYQIFAPIYDGFRTVVYRGKRISDQTDVIIKVLKNHYPSFLELVQFRSQYTIVKDLNWVGIVTPLSLKSCGNGFALIMKDEGYISLDQEIVNVSQREIEKNQQGYDLNQFFQVAIQLAQILAGLCQNQIIHKDIKPQNILIHPKTRQIKLIDFSIASCLPREIQGLQSPDGLEGTLAYMSPEQTGRMNRGIDYRTDFYSLGVTFYQLLTGKLPFCAVDPMELVHCHIARQPPAPKVVNPHIPQMVSDIILKLMAKTAEARYQSAFGLQKDLERCYHDWQSQGEIANFSLGTQDICDHFIISQQLYGRAVEVATLLQAFDRVSQGQAEIMLVAGFSGIGKTAIVNEVHKPIVRQRGYFIKGKFDQFQRDIPFSAFVQACQDLMGQLLTESDTQLKQWQDQILAALGKNGQVIIEVIPELEYVIGPQPPVPELAASAAQNRFNLLFQKFIQVFATPEHPLVLFLDDLQWADLASLQLLRSLMSEEDVHHLMLIGAYRDNEVNSTHPFMLTLAEIRSAQATVNQITLAPLRPIDLNALVADTLNCPLELATPLATLIFQKTRGNPFFANQFLQALHGDGLIHFVPGVSAPDQQGRKGGWQCDITQVRALALTDDVVEFMTLQLQKLPAATQAVVQLAACIGNQVDLSTLAMVQEKSQAETANDLWAALQAGLMLPNSEIYKFYQGEHPISSRPTQASPTQANRAAISAPQSDDLLNTCKYKFLHDRVQQAAYALVLDDQKQTIHLKIGRLLLGQAMRQDAASNQGEEREIGPGQPLNLDAAGQALEEKIFEIVNQLNMGMVLMTQQTERDQLARLNLMAGRKAIASTAQTAALGYFSLGLQLLTADSWQQHYDLTLALHEAAAEAAYLCGDFDQMERLIEVVLQTAQTLLDKVKVYEVRIQAYGAQNRTLAAIQTTLTVLQQLGVELPEQPTQVDVQLELEKTMSDLAGQPIQDLIHLPQMLAATPLAVMRLLSSAITFAYQAVPNLMLLMVFKQVSLSVHHGNAPLSAFAYVIYGFVLCSIVGDIESGYQLGQLALSVVEKFDAKAVKAKIVQGMNALIRPWKEHLKGTLSPLLEAYAIALETGDLEFVAVSLYAYSYTAYFSGKELTELTAEMATHGHVIEHIQQERVFNFNAIYQQSALNLLNPTENPCRLVGPAYNEEKMLPLHLTANDRTGLLYLYFNRLYLCYLFQAFPQALENATLAAHYLDGGIGKSMIPLFYFYDSLARLAALPDVARHADGLPGSDSSAHPPQQEHSALTDPKQILAHVVANQEKMKIWADYAPMNHRHKFHLVEAERYRVLGHKLEAMEMYEQAIAGAQAHDYIQEEALANELAARFYLNWGKAKIAKTYLIDAYYAYARWGAKAKIADLENRYAQFLAPILKQKQVHDGRGEDRVPTIAKTGVSDSADIAASLDLTAVMQAAQALAVALELEQLLSTLMQVLMKNGGAEKGVLIIPKARDLVIEAMGVIDQDEKTIAVTLLQSRPISTSQLIPVSLINYVARTQATVVLDDATQFHAENEAANSMHNLPTPAFHQDPYVIKQQPKSVLCLPLNYQGQLIGVLYLENSLATAAFTAKHLQALKLLTAQAAISLANARLYEQKKQQHQELALKNTALEQAKHVAEAANRAKSTFLAKMSHELRTPLNAILGFGQLLYQDPAATPEQKANLGIINRSGEHLLALINDVLEVTRIEAGKTTLNHQDFDLYQLLSFLQEMFNLSAQSKGIDLIFAPSAELPRYVRTDEMKLRQVLMNLLGNAIKFTQQGSVTLRVRAEPPDTLCSRSYTLHFEVEDTGPGIAPDELDTIFAAFAQTETG